MSTLRLFKSLKWTRLLVISSAVGLAAGCASQAQPNYFNGHYYMAGDDDCKYMKAWRGTAIECFDSAGNSRGLRYPLTQQEVNYQYAQQYQQQVQMQQMNMQMQQFNQQIQQQNQAMQQQSQQYIAPQVTPLQQPGGDQIRCITAGIVTNCRY